RIHRASAHPGSTLQLVFDAVREITNSVVYATAIIVLIFLPIFFLGDLAGRIFSPLGIAYIASVGASLVVAVTMVPALCYLLLIRHDEKRLDADVALDAGVHNPAAHAAPASEPHDGKDHETRFVLFIKRHFR